MKTKALFLVVLLCTSITSALTGCSDEQIEPENTTETKEGKFTLYASVEEPDSRLAMEGLELKWEDGDKLYMVNTAGGDPIELVTSLSEPATTAVFSSENEVPEGTYYVMYNNQSFEFETPMTYIYQTGEEATSQIKLCSEPLTIQSGETSATITLKHTQAKITFNITNGGTAFEIGSEECLGIALENGGFNLKGTFSDGNMNYTMKDFIVGAQTQASTSSVELLVFPNNLADKNLHFFVITGDKFYEIIKQGKDLQAGFNYTINFDISQAEKTDMELEWGWQRDNLTANLSNVKQFNAFACMSNILDLDISRVANLMDDLDFKGETFFPIGNIIDFQGNSHSLKNITIDYEFVDNMGIIRKSDGYISNLTIENINVKGHDYVGAILGRGVHNFRTMVNCHLQGENIIEGNNIVGGLVGEGFEVIDNCSAKVNVSGQNFVGGISGNACDITNTIAEGNVEGVDYVGGIIGQGENISNCTSAVNVQGNNYVGGILGLSLGYSIVKCGSNGNVFGNECVGGIIGNVGNSMSISSSYSTGDISGNRVVGGIVGLGNHMPTMDTSYSTGNIEAKVERAGGIIGECKYAQNMVACYSLGNITSPSDAAGIIGYLWVRASDIIHYCYSVGEISEGGSGIVNCESVVIENCATTFSNLNAAVTEGHEDFINCNGNDKTIRSVLSKGEEFNTYYSSSKDWAVEDAGIAGCPIFLWQSGGIQIGTGDSGTKAPAFVDGGSF